MLLPYFLRTTKGLIPNIHNAGFRLFCCGNIIWAFYVIYQPTLQYLFNIAAIRKLTSIYNIIAPHTDFSKSRTTFQDVQGNTG